MRPQTVADAARELRVSAKQVRVWLSRGAPCVRTRRPTLVDVDALRQWRRRPKTTAALEVVERELLNVLRCDAGDGRPAHERLRIRVQDAAVLILYVYDRLHAALLHHEPEPPYAEPIQRLRDIASAP